MFNSQLLKETRNLSKIRFQKTFGLRFSFKISEILKKLSECLFPTECFYND